MQSLIFTVLFKSSSSGKIMIPKTKDIRQKKMVTEAAKSH
jgi:hypothetical protein